MSGRVIGLAFTNKATGDKRYNNPLGGIGARTTPVRRAILTRTRDPKTSPANCACLNKFYKK